MSEPNIRSGVLVEVFRLHKFAFTDAIVIPVLGFVVLLLCWGTVGSGFGAYHVIWKVSPGVPFYDRAMFWSGFGVGLFFITCAYQIYILYALVRPERTGQRFAIVLGIAGPLIAAAHVGTVTDSHESAADKWPFPVGCVHAVFAVWLVVFFAERFGTWMSHTSLATTMKRKWSLAQHLPTIRGLERVRFKWRNSMERAARVADEYLFHEHHNVHVSVDPNRMALYRFSFGLYGTVIALYSAFVGFSLRDGTHWHWTGFTVLIAAMGLAIMILWALFLAAFRFAGTDSGWREKVMVAAWHLAAYGTAAIAGVAVGYFVRFLIATFAPWDYGDILVVPAALSTVLLFSVIGVLYGALKMFAGPNFYPACVLMVIFVIAIGMVRPYPHRIAALGDYYGERAVSLADFDPEHSLDGLPEAERPLDDKHVLAAWAKRLDPDGSRWDGRPPLVIVSTAGGGSTSAIYTFEALVAIEKAHPGFHRHVRLLTGASGGMLGAAVYRTWLRDLHDREAKRPANVPAAAIAREIEESAAPYRDGLAKDFLSPLAQALAFKDIPMGLTCPRGYADDRGRRLEQAWNKYFPRSLDSTFADLRQEERDGDYPTLIYSPMMVEPGRPLLISTIDLSAIASAERDEPYPDRIRGIEFMKLFPRDGWNLRLGTAARLSASFPFFTPAVSLPTIPGRRVVDAGYYDNYGVSVALAWVQSHHASDTLSPYVGDVILLELKPYGKWVRGQTSPTEIEQFRKTLDNWPRAFHELITPFEGLYNARDASMSIRNDDQRDQVSDIMHGHDDGRPVASFMPYVFRGGLATSLNWSLPRQDVEAIHKAARRSVVPLNDGQDPVTDDELNRYEWKQLQWKLKPRPPSESKPNQSGVKK